MLQVSEFMCYASCIARLFPEGHTAVIQRATSTGRACEMAGGREGDRFGEEEAAGGGDKKGDEDAGAGSLGVGLRPKES